MERGQDDISPDWAASALQWWVDAGVDIFVGEEPRDWLRPKAASAEPVGTVLPAARAKAPEPPADALPDQLGLFREWLKSHDKLPFSSPSALRVCPSGDPASGLMVFIDMPSHEDCASGTLLSGEAGRLFDRMMAAIGRDRASLYLAAASCFQTPGGQLAGEPAKQCSTLARHHIGLAAPRAVLVFGDAASKVLLGLPVTRARAHWHEVETHAGPVRATATFHPTHLLKRPADKAHAWADLQMVMQGLNA